MDQKLKIAVVGLGRIGWQFHFAQTLASDQFELCAVVDPYIRIEESRELMHILDLCRRSADF